MVRQITHTSIEQNVTSSERCQVLARSISENHLNMKVITELTTCL